LGFDGKNRIMIYGPKADGVKLNYALLLPALGCSADGMTEKISGHENEGRNSAIHRLWREVTAASARPYAGMYTHASVSRVSMIE
jgi:hypothetical protein